MNNDLKLENDNQFIILPSAYDEQVFGKNNLEKKTKELFTQVLYLDLVKVEVWNY